MHNLSTKTLKTREPISDQALMRLAHHAHLEREQLLQQRPHLQVYQDEIDRLLQSAGLSTNRLSVMALLLEAKLNQLKHQLHLLATLTAPNPEP